MIFSEVIGGVTVQDPFRWLEDDADPGVVAWQTRENARTVDALAMSPHAAIVAAAVRSTCEDLVAYSAFRHVGDNWFRTVLPPGAAKAVLHVSSSPRGPGRVLFDPGVHGDMATILGYTPSPDGRKVVVQIMAGATFRGIVIDVADGSVVRDLGEIMPSSTDWSPDSAGFHVRRFGVKTGADGRPLPEPQIWWQPLVGEAEQEPVEVDDPSAWTITAADGRWMAVCANQGSPRPIWVRRLDGGGWTRFLPGATAMYKGAFVGDEYWAITDDVSGWCRLVAIPLASAEDRSTWRELIPARDEIKLGAVTRCGDHVAVASIESGFMKLRSLDRTGRDLGYVPLPGDGAFGQFGLGHIMLIIGDVVAPDGDGCIFVHSSLDRGPGVYRADLATRTIEELEAPAHVFADHAVQGLSVEGPNGPVHYQLLRKASTPLDGSAPVIVTGYGGFNVPQIPHYSAMAAAWAELGGIWVNAQLRGGGERDTEFWLAGRMHRKQGTFDDLYAVIGDLHARGFAVPERTGIWGTSNGGLLVGAAITQRPDLVRAGVAQVPILDLMQCRKDPGTLGITVIDYGNPDDPADAPVLHAYSPYHNVRQGVRYPALLCDASAEDDRCQPWHSRKMVAAVQEANGADSRILLRVREGAGHNLMTSEMLMERDVEELVFLYDELMG